MLGDSSTRTSSLHSRKTVRALEATIDPNDVPERKSIRISGVYQLMTMTGFSTVSVVFTARLTTVHIALPAKGVIFGNTANASASVKMKPTGKISISFAKAVDAIHLRIWRKQNSL